MNSTVRNVFSVIAGVILGSAVNMGIIMVSGSIIPPPEGVDMTTMEGLKESMHLLEPHHFILPFVAHALGTLTGAWITVKMVTNYKMKFALSIGIFFLIGGTMNTFMLPSPIWFTVLDLAGAYIPMAWIGWKLAEKKEV